MLDRTQLCEAPGNMNAADSFQTAMTLSANGRAPRAANPGAPPCECYVTRDLLTEPPTTVCIVPDANTASSALARAGRRSDTFYVTFADVEPTAGWLSDRNNATLDICFMHSFGKCFGKAKERNACTCHQIHLKRNVLDNLRRYYKNPQRHYFCRTIKANVSDRFAQVLSLLARRRFSIQYLEFKKENVDVTAGSTAYEVSYRQWLLGDSPSSSSTSSQHGAAFTDNYISDFNLCWDFSLTGRCPKGATCPDIHGHTEKALTKDRHVRVALEELKRKEATLDVCQSGPLNAYTFQGGPSRDSAPNGSAVATSYAQAVNYGPMPVQHPAVAPLAMPQGNPGFRVLAPSAMPSLPNQGQGLPADGPHMWQPGPVPPYYNAGNFRAPQPQPQPTPPYPSSGPVTSLVAPPPPPPSGACGGPQQSFVPQGAQSGLPLFFISEGTDNILRLVPINGFGGFTDCAQPSR